MKCLLSPGTISNTKKSEMIAVKWVHWWWRNQLIQKIEHCFVSLHVERKMGNCNPRKKNGRKQRRKKERQNIISNQYGTAVAVGCYHCKIPFSFNGKSFLSHYNPPPPSRSKITHCSNELDYTIILKTAQCWTQSCHVRKNYSAVSITIHSTYIIASTTISTTKQRKSMKTIYL